MDNSEIINAIGKSGFPVEVECAKKLKDLGYKVNPSMNFYDYFRNKNTELDIRGIKSKTYLSQDNPEINCMLTIAIECKKFSDPLVLFNIPNENLIEDEYLDDDSFYCHINTSKDKAPNYFAFPIFDSKSTKIHVKKNHHHFLDESRAYNLTQLEKYPSDNKTYRVKLHTPQSIKYSLEKLGAYAFNFNHQWFEIIKNSHYNLETKFNASTINVLFLILVHSCDQFKRSESNSELSQEKHLVVFHNIESIDKNVRFVVDLVSLENLGFAIKKIETTYNYMINHLIKWFHAQK